MLTLILDHGILLNVADALLKNKLTAAEKQIKKTFDKRKSKCYINKVASARSENDL
ncbi:hypothetical protein BSBH6_02975 [Bacillus subtilis]|nr:hypothetical protein BSBH6_02975 [Bacillus subtilis]RPK22913.1 hypothetical protein BH5_02981 [Bacillus subtilis]